MTGSWHLSRARLRILRCVRMCVWACVCVPKEEGALNWHSLVWGWWYKTSGMPLPSLGCADHPAACWRTDVLHAVYNLSRIALYKRAKSCFQLNQQRALYCTLRRPLYPPRPPLLASSAPRAKIPAPSWRKHIQMCPIMIQHAQTLLISTNSVTNGFFFELSSAKAQLYAICRLP